MFKTEFNYWTLQNTKELIFEIYFLTTILRMRDFQFGSLITDTVYASKTDK